MRQQTLLGGARQLRLVAIAGVIAAIVAVVGFGLLRPADASSHREAPFISGDPEGTQRTFTRSAAPTNRIR